MKFTQQIYLDLQTQLRELRNEIELLKVSSQSSTQDDDEEEILKTLGE